MRRSAESSVMIAWLFLVLLPEAVTAQHADDLWIGRSSDATGRQLKLAVAVGGYDPFDPVRNCVALSPASGFFEGWSGDEPGFDAIQVDSPENDVFVMDAGADIRLDIVHIDPALVIIAPPNYDIFDSPGQSAPLGNERLHGHLIWLIDSTSPGYNPDQCTWRATFRLRDAGSTAYAQSMPFTIRFARASVSPADFDCDGDVDLADFGKLRGCFNGPNSAPAQSDCGAADLDGDTDVDLTDFGWFRSCFNGPNRPPSCG